MVGLGGKLVEVLGDVAVRIAPLTDDDIEDMLQSLKSYRLLTGYRGAPALDVDALRQVLHRVSALVDDLPEIAEMDLNPVFVLEKGPWRPTCAFVLPTIPHHYPECGPHSPHSVVCRFAAHSTPMPHRRRPLPRRLSSKPWLGRSPAAA